MKYGEKLAALAWYAAVAALVWAGVRYVLVWLLPFLLALGLAMALEPLMEQARRRLRLKRGFTAAVVTLVLGVGHSIGVPLAVCGKETFIAPTASMTVHPVRMSGTVIAAPETYRYFERLQERIIQFVAANSRVTAERFRELMLSSGDMANDVGTVLYGEQAVAEGIIDRIGTLGDALEALYGQIERRHG